MKRSTRKKDYSKSVRLNISLPPLLDDRKAEVVTKYGLSDFSGYVQARMRKDLGLELAA